MKSCGKSFAQCKSQKMVIFFKYPRPFRGAVATLLPKGLTTSFGLSEWTVMSNHSPQVPSQHKLPIQCSQNAYIKPQCLCTGCAVFLEHSTLTCSPPLPVRLLLILQTQVSSLLCFLMPPLRISCFLSLGRKELMDTKPAINQASASPACSLRDFSN